jgi:hypothetical protein
MSIYSVIDRLRAGDSDRWFIERVMPRGTPPIRFEFKGTRAEAQAEADRLNAFVDARVAI